MSYGHANCQKCGRPTFVYPGVGEDESWVICERCAEDGVAVNWPEYARRLEAEKKEMARHASAATEMYDRWVVELEKREQAEAENERLRKNATDAATLMAADLKRLERAEASEKVKSDLITQLLADLAETKLLLEVAVDNQGLFAKEAREARAELAALKKANRRLAGQLANHKLLPGIVQASDLVGGLDALWIAWAAREETP